MSKLLFSICLIQTLFFIINISGYNLRFGTRLAKKHPNIWSFIELIQREHIRFEHISIQLDAGACATKQSKKTKAFQMRFDTLHERFRNQEINAKELLSGLSLLIGKKKNRILFYCQLFLVFFSNT
jgi:hypothetical protein